jgi:hypothetical protein
LLQRCWSLGKWTSGLLVRTVFEELCGKPHDCGSSTKGLEPGLSSWFGSCREAHGNIILCHGSPNGLDQSGNLIVYRHIDWEESRNSDVSNKLMKLSNTDNYS